MRTSPGVIPFPALWAVLGEYALYPIALIPLLFLLYPNGHVPSPRWRWAVRGLIGGTLLAFFGFLLRPGPLNNWVEQGILWVNPLGIDALEPVGGVLIAIGAIVALVSALSTAIAVDPTLPKVHRRTASADALARAGRGGRRHLVRTQLRDRDLQCRRRHR